MTSSEFVGSIAEINEVRSRDPRRIKKLLASRTRRELLGADGRLMIVACDHPARGALGAAGRPMAMASRVDLLGRLVAALSRPGVDGLLATADIAEDLLLLGALEGKLVFSSLNRGGLQGSSFEIDDRNTSYDVQGTVEAGFDGIKMLTRIDLDDPGTVRTLERQGQVVTEANRAELIAMVEPFMSSRRNGKIVNDLSPDAVIRSIHIAQGLGASSAYTWMKLPVVHEMERVMAATTLPTLLLGGDPDGAPDETYAAWQAALAAAVGAWPGRRPDDALPRRRRRRQRRRHRRVVVDESSDELRLPACPPAARRAGDYELEVSPERAGWGYSSLRIVQLDPAGTMAFETDATRSSSSRSAVQCQWSPTGSTASWTAGPTSSPVRPTSPTSVSATSRRCTPSTGGRFALCGARTDQRLPLRYLAASAVPVELRGAGQSSRQVRNFGTPDTLDASRIIACEVITPAGNWSSYPAHKHDEATETESELEEIYYFEIAAGPSGQPGFGFMRTSQLTGARHRPARGGPGPGHRAGAVRLARTVRRRPRARHVLPERDGRPGGGTGLEDLRPPRPDLGPRDLAHRQPSTPASPRLSDLSDSVSPTSTPPKRSRSTRCHPRSPSAPPRTRGGCGSPAIPSSCRPASSSARWPRRATRPSSWGRTATCRATRPSSVTSWRPTGCPCWPGRSSPTCTSPTPGTTPGSRSPTSRR